MVEMEVKVINLEHCCIGGSTPVVVQSTKVVEDYMAKMVGWLTGNVIEVQNTSEEV